MIDKSNMFWTVYKKLEKDVVDLSYYIHFTDEPNKKGHNQIWTFSNQIADLLIAISTQIESLFLELYKSEFDKKPDGVGTAIKEIDKKWNLSEKQVKIISKNMYFTDINGFGSDFSPMAYEIGDSNDYYAAYCAVKHERINTLHKANINVLIRALSALFVLNVYYSFEQKEVDDIAEFDFSFNSDVFVAKYEFYNNSSNAIVFIKEDTEYLKKVDDYTDKAPSSDNLQTFMQYFDTNPAPRRFALVINK